VELWVPKVNSNIFDRAHTTAYSTLIETTHLSCTVFELWVIRRKWLTLTYHTFILGPIAMVDLGMGAMGACHLLCRHLKAFLGFSFLGALSPDPWVVALPPAPLLWVQPISCRSYWGHGPCGWQLSTDRQLLRPKAIRIMDTRAH